MAHDECHSAACHAWFHVSHGCRSLTICIVVMEPGERMTRHRAGLRLSCFLFKDAALTGGSLRKCNADTTFPPWILTIIYFIDWVILWLTGATDDGKNAQSCWKQLLRQPTTGNESESLGVDSSIGQEWNSSLCNSWPVLRWHPAGPQQTWNSQLFMPQLRFFFLQNRLALSLTSAWRQKKTSDGERSVKFSFTRRSTETAASSCIILSLSGVIPADMRNTGFYVLSIFHRFHCVCSLWFCWQWKTFWFRNMKGQSTSLLRARHSHSRMEEPVWLLPCFFEQWVHALPPHVGASCW